MNQSIDPKKSRIYTFDFTIMQETTVIEKGRANVEGVNYDDAEGHLISRLNSHFKTVDGKLAIVLQLREVLIDMTWKTLESTYIHFKTADAVPIVKPAHTRILTPGS